MIALGSDFLVFRLASGESLPLSAEMVSADLMAGTKTMFEPEFVDHAASAVFYYSSAHFETQGGSGCTTPPLNIANVSSCTGNNVPVVVNSMQLALPLDPAAPVDNKLMGLPSANQNPAPNVMNGTTNPAPLLSGVRPTENTPIGQGLRSIRTGPGGPYYPASPPLPPGVVQKNFVMVLTDGNNNCNNNNPDPAAEARALFNNPPGVRQAETLLIAYAPDAGIDEANFMSRAGSGGTLSACPPGYQPANCSGCSFTCYTCPPGSLTCRDAFRANNVADLKAQLKAALDIIQQTGQFSATQSIAATVFELDQPPAVADPLNPLTRYNDRVNTLYESTFEVQGWQGKLKAFKNDGTFAPVQVPPGTAAVGAANWEAGQTLFYQVIQGAAGSMRLSSGVAITPDRFTFAELHGGATMANIETTGHIRRRIFTSPGNGAPINQAVYQRGGNFDSALSSGTNVVALWPPNPAGVNPMDVDPLWKSSCSNTDPTCMSPPTSLPGLPAGSIDDILGIGEGSNPKLTFAQLKANFGACEISTSGPGPTQFPVGPPQHPCLAFNIPYARKEAREIILASMAGAKIAKGADGKPLRWDAGVSEGLTQPLMLFRSKDWLLGDSTLATPAIVSPPLKNSPEVHTKEWVLYRDGRRDINKRGIDEISSGFGLRNPDLDDPAPSPPTLKPVKTTVYIGANDATVHAFSAETSREMWAFLPFDQLRNLPRLLNGQITEPHIYGVATAIRVVDMFVPGQFTLGGVLYDGRWRTVLYFGRGAGGKNVTALDVTSPGPFTKSALTTYLPWVMWSRGNPDTVNGLAPNGTNNIDITDTAHYATMGECWSVPAIGNIRFVDANNDGVSDTPEWRLFMGSGCTDTPAEGSSFYIVNALNGDILERTDVGDGPPSNPDAAIVDNILIAPAAGWNPLQMSPPGVPGGADHLTRVFIPDVKGRIFKFNPEGGNASPVPAFRDEGIFQPFGNAVALLNLGASGDFVYAEAGNDNRVLPWPKTTPPFKMFAFNDPGQDTDFTTPGTVQFTQDFPSPFRGTVQPATAFNDTSSGRVFFAGTALVDGGQTCIFRFDTFLFALGALSGGAVYDFNNNGLADLSTTLQGTKTMGIQTTGGQVLLSDSGEIGRAPAPPPPPAGVPAPNAATPPFVNTLRMSPDSSVCRP